MKCNEIGIENVNDNLWITIKTDIKTIHIYHASGDELMFAVYENKKIISKNICDTIENVSKEIENLLNEKDI